MSEPANTYTGLLPGLPASDREALRANIAANGVRIPIVKDQDGNTIDGHHREAIAAELGLDCPVEVRTYGSELARMADALALNLARRNLTSEQRAEVRKRQIEVYLELRESGLTQAQAAAMVGSSKSTGADWESNVSNSGPGKAYKPPDRREKLTKEDIAEIVTRSSAGESQQPIADDLGISRVRVSQILKREQAKADRQQQLRDKAVGDESGSASIYRESATDLLAREIDIDLLLTDPPFSTDLDQPIGEFVDSWLPVALDKMASTGRAYIFFGAYPEEVVAYLSALSDHSWVHGLQLLGWTYRNMMGPDKKMGYQQNWQAIAYAHGPDAPAIASDQLSEKYSIHLVNHPADGRGLERVHKWQKPNDLAEMFIRHSTERGQLVVDPFAGSGTFLAAAARLGRNAVGADVDPSAFQICEGRGVRVNA